ncbi:Alpha-monoglucosyldiacylglycerol synthase [Pseudooceanicola marinus]|uniref:Alpha-monoglucosyldiacylglycerol synthase n=1 Tax=Pseudooceanicola marinus TaxID=396013 RepID=A0A1X6YEQ0_9RHOB|nr:glycosyltransferase [Pseudooceanicola marinus]PJE32927.1 glycosyl transferase family 1 [Pseudooceanicola marinus]SLN18276.1 Alpha-monoglucosyldiacylglycerol synthase [Pseudooceanicola marinus]
MTRRRLLSILLILNVAVLVSVLGYKTYLYLNAPASSALLVSQIDRIEETTRDKGDLSIAVIGDANNSIGVFENEIVPRINASGVDFVVSAGNIVSSGGEDKYRAILGTLSHLHKPYLLTFAKNEFEEFGGTRFYQRFGPYFYSVDLPPVRLVFLDATGRTPTDWQESWLRDILRDQGDRPVLVFLGTPLVDPVAETLFQPDSGAWSEPEDRERLLELLETLGADVVVSAGASTYSDQVVDGVRHIITGGAGGFVLNDETSFYHYLELTVGPDGTNVTLVPLDTAPTTMARRIEGLWFYVYSLFYVGIWNFLLIFTGLVLLGVYLYNRLFRDRHYYPSYEMPEPVDLGRPMRIAMFTNTYLPFTGGVPVSVERLKRGLEAQGHEVLLVCPAYGPTQDEPGVLRVPTIFRSGAMIRLANPLHPRTWRTVRDFAPDVVHLHHPFWLGSLGLRMARALKVPTVFTYHTRLEHFAHMVPLPGAVFRNVVAHWIISRFANRCDRVIVPTPVTRDYIRLIGVDVPVDVQPTGVEIQLYGNQPAARLDALRQQLNPDGRLLLVTVSRLSPEKNLGFILSAMARLKTEGAPSFRLLVLGDGEERTALETQIDTLGIGGDVSMLGDVPSDEVPSHLAIADIFVFASAAETQGMVVLEAMAAGLPVVAVNSSGIDAFVKTRCTGYATPENLAIWTDTLHGLMVARTERESMGAAAGEAAAKYSIEAFSERVVSIYQAAIAASRAR